MFGKILKHLREGDLIRVAGNYLKHLNVQHRISKWREIKAKQSYTDFRLTGNAMLRLYTDSILSEPIYIGKFENTEIDFVSTYLQPGDTFVDVGANIGLFTILGAAKTGDTGKVFAFEPVKKTYTRLLENKNLNHFSHVEIFNIGLSDEDGELEMVTSTEGFDAWNSFGKPTAGSNFTKEFVQTKKLSTWLREHNVSGISLMKIDVEGWEIPVLKGGMEFFKSGSAPDLLVEFTEENCINAGFSCRELYIVLAGAGYSMYTYDDNRRILTEEPIRNKYTHLNIIATKNIERVRSRIK